MKCRLGFGYFRRPSHGPEQVFSPPSSAPRWWPGAACRSRTNIVRASSSASTSAKAVLSPKPLGPATQFAPVRIEARADRANPAPSAPAERATRAKAHGRSCARGQTARRALARSWRGDAAIRSTPKRPIRGFRPGRAGPAASATGSEPGVAAIRRVRIRASRTDSRPAPAAGTARRDTPSTRGGDRKQVRGNPATVVASSPAHLCDPSRFALCQAGRLSNGVPVS